MWGGGGERGEVEMSVGKWNLIYICDTDADAHHTTHSTHDSNPKLRTCGENTKRP